MSNKRKKSVGPKPDILKIDGDWRGAMKKAIEKKPPEKGWPKPAKRG